jgi:hypothetical protein
MRFARVAHLPALGVYMHLTYECVWSWLLSCQSVLSGRCTAGGGSPSITIEIDFSPKAPRVGKLMAVWDGSGLQFSDGNRWPKVKGLNDALVLF